MTMLMSIIPTVLMWFISFIGIAFAVAVFWRFLFGTKVQAGYLQQWQLRTARHEAEQTAMDRDQRAEYQDTAKSLRILTQSEEPPKGAAYVAQELVSRTSASVDELKLICEEIKQIVKSQDVTSEE